MASNALQRTARQLLGAVVLYELYQSEQRWEKRRDYFNAATERARQSGRRLVVIGDPHSGGVTRLLAAYDCGDLCVDVMGCPACTNAEAVDLSSGQVHSIADNSAVVFVSCTLEYVPDPQVAWTEIIRMAGSPENVFVVTMGESGWGPAAVLWPGTQWTIDYAPPAGTTVVADRVSLARKILVGGALAFVGYLAIWGREPSDVPTARKIVRA